MPSPKNNENNKRINSIQNHIKSKEKHNIHNNIIKLITKKNFSKFNNFGNTKQNQFNFTFSKAIIKSPSKYYYKTRNKRRKTRNKRRSRKYNRERNAWFEKVVP